MSVIHLLNSITPMAPAFNGISNSDFSYINGITNFWPSFAGDNFTGDNGDPPNLDIWHINKSASQDAVSIYNNRARGVVADASATAFTDLHSNFWLNGDFDIEVDWEKIVGGNTNRYDLIFRVIPDTTPNSYVQIFRAYSTSKGNHYGANKKTNGTFGTTSTAGTAATSGSFRITRVGIAMKSYYGASLLRSDNWLNENVYVQLSTQTTGSFPDVTCDWEDFIINSGTIVIQ